VLNVKSWFTKSETVPSEVAVDELITGSIVIPVIAFGIASFLVWACFFELDQFVRATGKVFSSSRIQLIQSVDGGVLAELNVSEGDRVVPGQVLARVDQSRFEASTNEIVARIDALKAKIARLRAEITGSTPLFPEELATKPELLAIEFALYERRRKSLRDDTVANTEALRLAESELAMVNELLRTGDVDRTEVFKAERGVIDARAKLNARKNEYYEKVGQELTQAEDELAQNNEIHAQRKALLESSVMRALMPGIVKNIEVTTIGAVLKAGEPLMEIIPTGDTLLVEAKIQPKDIADLENGLEATLRLDPYDSTIHGALEGSVVFISGDTMIEETSRGEETYYKAHISLPAAPFLTSIGKTVDIIPGMTTQVDIKTGKRSVLTYLLKPIVKTLDESFGER
jgi:adhesin transport system membrane fusion protein